MVLQRVLSAVFASSLTKLFSLSLVAPRAVTCGTRCYTNVARRVGPRRQTRSLWRQAAAVALVLPTLALTGGVEAHNPHDPVQAFSVSPNFADDRILFVATFPEAHWGHPDLLRSTDGGHTWHKVPKGLANRTEFSAIQVSPHFRDDRAVFAATRGDGVFRSLDKGGSWALFNTGLAGLNIRLLEIAAADASGTVMFVAPESGGLYRRTDSQLSWDLVINSPTKIKRVAVAPDFAVSALVAAIGDDGQLRISTDSGLTWVSRGNPSGGTIHDAAITPGYAPEILLATSQGGIYRSNDSGRTFIHNTRGLPAEATNNVAVSPNYLADRTVFATSLRNSVYRSTDAGNSWVMYRTGAKVTGQTSPLTEFSDLQVSPSFQRDGSVFLAAFDGLFGSSDGGVTWKQSRIRERILTGLALSPAFATDQGVMVTEYSGAGIYASFSAGGSWSRVSENWPSAGGVISMFDITFASSSEGPPVALAARNHSNFGFSNDFGSNWRVMSIPQLFPVQTGAVYFTTIGVSPNYENDRVIYFGTRSHGVVQTRDGGSTWITLRGVPASSQITSMSVSPNYAEDRTAFASTFAGGVWRTQDGGDSWSQAGRGAIVSRVGRKFSWVRVSPNFVNDGLVLVGTNNGVYRSRDRGDNWGALSYARVGSSKVIQQVEFSPGFKQDHTVFVNVRGEGLYRLTLDTAANVQSSQNMGATLLSANAQFVEFQLSPRYTDDATIFGISRDSVYRSTNGGLEWTMVGRPSRR